MVLLPLPDGWRHGFGHGFSFVITLVTSFVSMFRVLLTVYVPDCSLLGFTIMFNGVVSSSVSVFRFGFYIISSFYYESKLFVVRPWFFSPVLLWALLPLCSIISVFSVLAALSSCCPLSELSFYTFCRLSEVNTPHSCSHGFLFSVFFLESNKNAGWRPNCCLVFPIFSASKSDCSASKN